MRLEDDGKNSGGKQQEYRAKYDAGEWRGRRFLR
jgi:hypothetical protein